MIPVIGMDNTDRPAIWSLIRDCGIRYMKPSNSEIRDACIR